MYTLSNPHPSVTMERVTDLYSDETMEQSAPDGSTRCAGICIQCGSVHDQVVEPEAEYLSCHHCGKGGVFGVQGLMLHMAGWPEERPTLLDHLRDLGR